MEQVVRQDRLLLWSSVACTSLCPDDCLPRVHGGRGPVRSRPSGGADPGRAVRSRRRGAGRDLDVQRRLRDLTSRVGVYFLLAMCLFPEVGYRLVWQKLTAGLAGLNVAQAAARSAT
ncbi:transposase domain-containing protein [Streptomyces lunaelactis]|nr:transposase domain-containing protein [Streptomyces lunaelactis]